MASFRSRLADPMERRHYIRVALLTLSLLTGVLLTGLAGAEIGAPYIAADVFYEATQNLPQEKWRAEFVKIQQRSKSTRSGTIGIFGVFIAAASFYLLSTETD